MQLCKDCRAFQMHTYLQEHGQIAEEGSYLTGLESEVNRLQVALQATVEEKERCRKLAVEYALKADGYQTALERCENMKLAREFEELLQTTSIPVAVDKVKATFAELEQYKRALELACRHLAGTNSGEYCPADYITHDGALCAEKQPCSGKEKECWGEYFLAQAKAGDDNA